ncbi:putative metal-binding motif-containing protein [bacterium]|nr:putative metal-binding motif-containing protein [bacterium]
MKKFYAILCLAIASLTQLQAQAPQGFNYQATVRSAGGGLIVNQNVYFKFNVIQGSLTSVPVFTETHYVPTDDLGQVNLIIGQGSATLGAFSELDWSLGSYYLGIELDTDTGNSYVAMGTTQLLSVPFALYAENSGAEASDLQGVLDTGATANLVVSEENLSGIELSITGGVTENNDYNGISSSINGTNGRNIAVSGESNGINLHRNYGLRGTASNAEVTNTGVQGIADSAIGTNFAVWGIAKNAVDGKDNRGVMGHAYTPTPTGNNYGVSGWVGGSEVVNIALGGYADAADSTDGSNFGVDAKANAATVNGFNYGVYTQASNAPLNYGIHSRADGTVGSNYGIHASASGGENNYAGYFVGDVVVTEGTLTADVTLASAPTEEMDAATKGYVDQLIAELQAEIQILKWKTSPLIGSWKLAPEAGALGVGPDLNNVSWWSNLSSDVTTRACLFDDEYVFGADGSFQNVLGTQTWLDPWQGTNPAACGAPVAPHNGTATATYNYDEAAGTITINGTGAFLGLAQVINGAQIASPADAASSITYIAAISDDGATLDLDIEYATPEGPSGFWSFKLVKGLHPDDVDNDNDGYTENQGDCDDIDASINPAATEIEDNIDNDCDGEIDEGFLVCDPETTESYSASNLNMTFQSDPTIRRAIFKGFILYRNLSSAYIYQANGCFRADF